MKITRIRMPGVACPACGAPAKARTSETITATCRDLKYACTDDDCGARFMATLEVRYYLRPSDRATSIVPLPLGPYVGRGQAAANDASPPANDCGQAASVG